MQTVVDDRMPKDLNDIGTFFTKVQALKPDVLLVSGHEKGAATAARQMGERAIEVPLIGMTHCEAGKLVNDFPKVAEGLVCPTQWDETMSAANYDKEMKAAHPEYNKVVPYQTAQATAAVYVWKDAFERAQSLDQERVREALTTADLATFAGHVRFAPDGSNPGRTIVMRQIQAGKYVVVAPAAVAAGSVVYPRDAHY
jgi:branched-chain amino acid transport system substrate-binding protein